MSRGWHNGELKQPFPDITMPHFDSPYFAAIDLGSNSFHMLVVRVNDEKIEIVDREKEMVQIARGLNNNSTLKEDVQERAILCLQRFAERLRNIPAAHIRAVGTKTLRAAKNSKVFLRRATKALGAPIQIISGFEEARLVYKGISHTITNLEEKRLVIDIGGGSTEFIIGEGFTPIVMESLNLGCGSFTRNFFKTGVSAKTMRRAYLAARTELELIRRNYRKEGWKISYGTSGTMKAIAELLQEQDGGASITVTSLNQLAKETAENGGITHSSLHKLRIEVLPAGIAILQAIFDELKIETLRVADSTLKEGLIYDTIGRFSDHDIRIDTVARLTHQYSIDQAQANRVKGLALRLWSQISTPPLPGISRTKVIDWAAQLHEIGLSISHSGYHHHGHYILRHSDLAGFGRYEQYILANLVRFHRKKINLDKLEGMNDSARTAFLPLLFCIRLAVLFYRRREDIRATPELSLTDNTLIIKVDAQWLEAHPLTQAGLLSEANYIKNTDYTFSIEAVTHS